MIMKDAFIPRVLIWPTATDLIHPKQEAFWKVAMLQSQQETITITDLQREVVQAAPVPVHVELDVVTVLLSPDTGDVFRLVFR